MTFAPDVKPDPSGSVTPVDKTPVDLTEDDGLPKPPTHLDGIIGQLEIYRSGAVKMRLKNGILLDVSVARMYRDFALNWDLRRSTQQLSLPSFNKQPTWMPNRNSLSCWEK